MPEILSAAALAVSLFTAVCAVVLLIRRNNTPQINDESLQRAVGRSVEHLGSVISSNQRDIGDMQTQRFAAIDRALNDMRATVERRLDRMRTDSTAAIDKLREENSAVLEKMRRDNLETMEKLQRMNSESLEKLRTETTEQLNLIRGTVDESSRKRLNHG